ncbi:hypothetical protein ASG39_10565 [Rhizobium sp. Leaf371]|nr:hypothetical protein ASG39_10565 [Rhizobium sp. Leaf371]
MPPFLPLHGVFPAADAGPATRQTRTIVQALAERMVRKEAGGYLLCMGRRSGASGYPEMGLPSVRDF